MMIGGREATDSDKDHLSIGSKRIECVNEFQHLDSVVSSHGRVDQK